MNTTDHVPIVPPDMPHVGAAVLAVVALTHELRVAEPGPTAQERILAATNALWDAILKDSGLYDKIDAKVHADVMAKVEAMHVPTAPLTEAELVNPFGDEVQP